MSLTLLLFGIGALLLVIELVFNVWTRWKYRHIPGPTPEGSAGHLRRIAASNLFEMYRDWSKQYGPVMLTYLGRQPVVVISDADLARQVGIKQFQIFHDRVIPPIIPLTGKRFRAMAGLIAATTWEGHLRKGGCVKLRGSYWTSLRSAVMPLFHTPRLHEFAKMMVSAADTLVGKLQQAGVSGKAVDIRHLLGRLTMEVVGITAFGLHLQLQEPDPSRRVETELVDSVENLFATPFSNRAAFAVMMLPKPLGDLFRLMLALFPSKDFLHTDVSRTTLYSTNAALVEGARRRAQKEGKAVAAPVEDWKWWTGETAASSYFSHVLPMRGSVIDLLLSASNRETGTGFTDRHQCKLIVLCKFADWSMRGCRQITSQCNVLLSAGYETTASALSFTIYHLATHPEAEAGLLAEVDRFGRDRTPSYADLEHLPYSRAVIYESMRLLPPVLLIPRLALQDTQVPIGTGDQTAMGVAQGPYAIFCDCMSSSGKFKIIGKFKSSVGGYRIPKGTWVYIAISNLHMDTVHWPQPEQYRPERFMEQSQMEGRHPQAFMPFGVGPRLCIGWRFAVEEAQIALIRLYQRYTFRLAPGAPDPLPCGSGSPAHFETACRST